jgi:hypothetical protein
VHSSLGPREERVEDVRTGTFPVRREREASQRCRRGEDKETYQEVKPFCCWISGCVHMSIAGAWSVETKLGPEGARSRGRPSASRRAVELGEQRPWKGA